MCTGHTDLMCCSPKLPVPLDAEMTASPHPANTTALCFSPPRQVNALEVAFRKGHNPVLLFVWTQHSGYYVETV